MRAIILNATSRAEWPAAEYNRPVAVGVHLVSQKVCTEKPVAAVTPRVMHQDGETYGYVHLVERHNVDAGWNVVASNDAIGLDPASVPREMTLQRFCLERPLQGFGLRDADVSHGVEPVSLSEGCTSGYRNTILIDLTPMREAPR
ncbi:2OG-Fe dioxygenase family protein [Breoghania sp. L-A4]|uniref:2OG-Fe dioxygenase family protein n=1 Tax=Breoghania sp. L-A4 TaxID=2304600 RepID=UPI0013C2C2F6|nr:2OG-Fe dioxygenase family protein [Breoghania sp. L-A4]